MPAPYSLDLRQKAIAALERGERKINICRTFGISRNTLDLWLKRLDQTQSLAATTDYHRGPKPVIDDLDAFRQLVEQHPDLTQAEIAEKLPVSVSRTTISQALRKINFTRKKNDVVPRAR